MNNIVDAIKPDSVLWAVINSLFSSFEHQIYLDCVKVKKFRIAMTKLRVASHRLEIEEGRWAKPNRVPVDERKCRHCNTLEDEFHFLLECSLRGSFKKFPDCFHNLNVSCRIQIEIICGER